MMYGLTRGVAGVRTHKGMAMRIRYENTVDDFVALARFHNDHSPAARRVRLRTTWLFAIGAIAITAGLAYKTWEGERERGDDCFHNKSPCHVQERRSLLHCLC